MKRLFGHIKNRLLSGLLLSIPLVITYLIVKLLFDSVDTLFATHVNALIQKYIPDYKPTRGIGVIISIFIIYIIGMLGSNVIIRKLISFGERMLTKIPLIKAIYTSVKQLIDALSITSSNSFRQAVYVEYPKEHVYVLGFLTNEFTDKAGRPYSSVFVPTTPNPTSGFLLFYPKDDVIPAGKTVDEAFKAIMSGAIVFNGGLPMDKKALDDTIISGLTDSPE
jgi:uncharacterized membrane protein